MEMSAAAAVCNARACQVIRLGRVPYSDAWALQREYVELRRAGEIPNRLLLLEHPPVITLGRNARREHLLSSADVLTAEGIDLVETNRGGDVTFHGVGQLVAYPILDLSRIRKDVVWYVRTLEEVVIRTLRELDLAAERRAGMTGVWVEDGKVAAIGVHISRWITSHGLALNVDTDLHYYRHIVPCGIARYPVTSLRELLGHAVDLSRPAVDRARLAVDRARLEERLAFHMGELFHLEMEWTSLEKVDRRERGESCRPPMC